MIKNIKKFMIQLLQDVNSRILFFEILLFSMILGSSLHSWPVACLMLLGLSWILNRHKGPLYMIFILRLVWGLAAMTIGCCFGGWGWAVTLGLLFLMFGVSIHFRDLKQPLYNLVISENENILGWEQNWPWGRHNLN